MPQQINLCSVALIKPRQQFEANTMVLALGVFVILGAALCTTWVWNLQNAQRGFTSTLQTQASEMQSLQTAIAQSKARAAPPSAELIQEAQAKKAEIQLKNQALLALQQGQFKPGFGHSDRLVLVARSIPDSVWITAVRADAGSMEVSGFTLEPSSLNDWVGRLAQSPLMDGLRLSTVKVQSTALAQSVGGAELALSAGPSGARAREAWSFNLVSAQAQAPGGAPMKAWWIAQSARINALSLRERLFVFISLLALALALADLIWLSPAQKAMKQVQQQFVTQSSEVNRLRAELALVSKPVDLNADVRAELAQSQATLDALNREIQALAPSGASGEPSIEPVLAQFLKRSPGLRLVSSGTVSADGATPATEAIPGITRRGLELKVVGPYNELTRYVKGLEQALPRLRWGGFQLLVGPQGPELTLRVYVLEAQP